MNKILKISTACILFFLFFSVCQASITLEVGLPAGGGRSVESAGDYISKVFTGGLAIAGILAVGMLVTGGFIYMTAGGNASGIEKAKDYIFGALFGLLLLLASYLILFTIDPRLVHLGMSIN